jgi:SpoVK/Ycf46/Vps4 family AAA+-type ATPase
MKAVIEYIKAGYDLIYVQTQDMERTVESIKNSIEMDPVISGKYPTMYWNYEQNQDAEGLIASLDQAEDRTVLMACNLNWFLMDDIAGSQQPNKMIVQMIQNRVTKWASKDYRRVMIVLSNVDFGDAIPKVLQRDFIPVEDSLPGSTEVSKALEEIVASAKNNPKFKSPSEDDKAAISEAALGLTQREMKNAFALSLIRGNGTMSADEVFLMKSKDIAKVPGVSIGRYKETFDSLKGYDALKEFTKRTLKSKLSKGIMALGPPGTGKSHFGKCLGNEFGIPVIAVEMAEMFGGIVGDTERNVKAFIDFVKAIGTAVVFVDEIEKGLAGMRGGGNSSDSVAKRAFGQLLKFMSDERPPGIYFYATCNDISSLPPEWVRPGRWDSAPFFIDLPNDEEKSSIYNYYLAKYDVKSGGATISDMKGWAGAEIETVCRMAAMMKESDPKATVATCIKFIIPTSKTMEEDITGLRKWAETRCIKASEAKINGKKLDREIEM